jgi:hypothetical protein
MGSDAVKLAGLQLKVYRPAPLGDSGNRFVINGYRASAGG